MAFDMHQQIPTFSPASVAAFLRETVVSLPTLDPEENDLDPRTGREDARYRRPFRAQNGSSKTRRCPGGALLRSRDHRPPGRHTSTRRPRVPGSHRRQARHGTHLARLVGLDIPGASGRSGRCRSLHAETPDFEETDAQEIDTMAECPQETCFWSDGAGCSLGHLDPSDCPALKAAPAPNQDDEPSPEAVAMPWSGSVLGLTDLGFVAGRSKPIVVAVMGPHNAGKTTLLGACYLLLGRGHRPNDELRFSGSCSLAGWENVASPLRWKPGSVSSRLPAAYDQHHRTKPGASPPEIQARRRSSHRLCDHGRPRRMVPQMGRQPRRSGCRRCPMGC